ncbi:MAG: metallophosphoesterase [Myxococcota bacterium]
MTVPPDLDDLAGLVARAATEENGGDKGSAFSVRRFAGPHMHVDQLDHIRVAHLTDLHVGRITPMAVQYRAVDIANAAHPDLVVMTGDFVCHSQEYLDALIDVVQRVHAPVLCVLGNHDHWAGGDEVRWALRKGGAEVLDNAHTTITVRHQPIQIVGLDDAYTGHADRAAATKGLRRDRPVLGLSHIAEEADALWTFDVPLVLSGHTHAGQVTWARLHELWLGRVYGHRYVHGLYGRRGEAGAVYVGAGVGASVMPLRLGQRARREVTIFELGQMAGSFEEDHDEQIALPGRPPSEDKRRRRIDQVRRKRMKRLRKRQGS